MSQQSLLCKELQVASLLGWYSQAIPAESALIYFLYRNDLVAVTTDTNTKRDVCWWRIIIIDDPQGLTSLKNPDFFTAKILTFV